MAQESFLSAPVLEQFLLQARFTRAVASLRLQEAHARLLGDLRIHRFRAGVDLELSGLHPRDQVPEEGTSVTLTILLGDEVLSLDATLLEPGLDAGGAVLLRLHWPTAAAHLHRRRDMRVAGPDQSPLKARVTLGTRTLDALVVNLTESGVGLALAESLRVELHDRVDIDATLPDGAHLSCPGEVRHITHLEDQAYPTRLGVVLTPPADMDMEPIHRFIQARRTDRSHTRAL
ncbi:MAG: PilZ domain-containing protein [Holophagaceae bacterium]|nr:PilZ domain-containing protein [Acidobacteriota bacterium]